MISSLLKSAQAGGCLWLPDLQDMFDGAKDSEKAVLRLYGFKDDIRDLELSVPAFKSAEEREFAVKYLSAWIFNLLSAAGGRKLEIYSDSEGAVRGLMPEISDIFENRGGYSKTVKVSRRICRIFGEKELCFEWKDIRGFDPAAAYTAKPGRCILNALARAGAEAEHTNCIGIDIGGTDIKLAASSGGKLAAVKEFDWNPARSITAEGITAPVLVLLRLMRAAIAEHLYELPEELSAKIASAMKKDAGTDEMCAASEAVEDYLKDRINVLDAVGISFPDVCIRDRIVGGETPKTLGMRNNPDIDYETEFAKITGLADSVKALCRDSCKVRIINDGNTAAFTAAMELAAIGKDPGPGLLAHTLGTDLGTGWFDENGLIPEMPLEMYCFLTDLGSIPQSRFAADDLRSTLNENSGLSDTRKYTSQAAAFRFAYEKDSGLLKGFIVEDGSTVRICDFPQDMRKPCLEHLMNLCGSSETADGVFREIGFAFGKLSLIMEKILKPASASRYIFGRFVKSEACFKSLSEGFSAAAPHLRLIAADDSLAGTGLMKQLAKRSDVTVAQFGQAVGSVYYALYDPD